MLSDEFKDALYFENYETAKRMITFENVNAVDKHGDGIIMLVCLYQCGDEVLRYFLQMGASPLLFSASLGRTAPLHVTVISGDYLMTKELLKCHRQSVFDVDNMGRKPLEITWYSVDGEDNYESRVDFQLAQNRRKCAKCLIDAGACAAASHWKPLWACEFMDSREKYREVAIVVLSLKRATSPVIICGTADILPMIARCIWSMRGDGMSDDLGFPL